MSTDVSIIIVNYNTEKLVLQCIGSLYKYSKDFSFEIIVVDNGSTDESVILIGKKFPGVKLIDSKSNLGFSRANNLGFKHAKGKYLFFLNPDTELVENSIKVFLDYLATETENKIGVVGCKMLDSSGFPHVSYGNYPSLWQEFFQYGFHKVFREYYKNKLSSAVIDSSISIKEVDYVIGANLFVSKDVFFSCGKFDEDFFLYYEETELCYRLKKNGFSIRYLPLTQIIHHYGAASKKQKKFNSWLFEQTTKSKFLYFRKCHGYFSALFLYVILIPRILIMSLQQKSLNLFKVFNQSVKLAFK